MAVTALRPSVPRSPTTSLRRNPAAAWRHLDIVVLMCVGAVSALGTLMVYSATRGPGEGAPFDTTFLKKQALFVAVGAIAMGVTLLLDYRVYRDWAPILYAGSVLLLVMVVSPLGTTSKGTQAWFQLGPFQLQPSELSKLGLILGLSWLLSQFKGEIDIRRLVAALLVAGLPFALIMLQPDLGTGLVFAMVTLALLLVAGARGRHLVALLLIAAMGTVWVMNSNVLQQYQKDRLVSFLNQGANLQGEAYNLNQSKIAIANGSMFGQGLFEGTQTRLNNVPEQHTDFIFTALGEELGFVGAATLLALYAIIAWRLWRTAQLARDPFGTYVCIGVLAMLLFQIFENVGMTMGIMPITGIPLPFMSYGGSSTIADFLAIGLVLNIHMRRFA
jgi:rod shape determining protein RodA